MNEMAKIISCSEHIRRFEPNERVRVVFTMGNGFLELGINEGGASLIHRYGGMDATLSSIFDIRYSYGYITPPLGMSRGEAMLRDMMSLYEEKKTIIKYQKSSTNLIKLETAIYGSRAYAKAEDVGEDAFGRMLLKDDMRVDFMDGKQYHAWYFRHENNGYFSRESFVMERLYLGEGESVVRPAQLIMNSIKNGEAVEVNGKFYEKEYAESVFEVNPHTKKLIKKFTPTESDSLARYHSGQGQEYYATKTPGEIYIGIEFEKDTELDSDVHRKITKAGWRAENDCSVTAEYITPILCLTHIDEAIDWIKETGQEVLDADISEGCGGHIHVSHVNIHADKLYRMMVTFMPLLWAIYPERAMNSYCSKPGSGENPYRTRGGHSDFVRRNLPTCEFRIFPGLKGEKTLRFRLTLLKFIVENAIRMGENNTFEDVFKFLTSSEELFDILSIVYNNEKKMETIAKRILNTYKEVIGTNNTEDPITFDVIPQNLIEFVKEKQFVRGTISP